MTADEPSRFARVVFRPTTFLVAALVLFLTDIALRAVALLDVRSYSVDEEGVGGLVQLVKLTAGAYTSLGGSCLWVSCVLFATSAYLWVHREK